MKASKLIILLCSVSFFSNAQTLRFSDKSFSCSDSMTRQEIYNPNCQIDTGSTAFIDSLANFLLARPEITISIAFHTDLRGSAEMNQKRSEICGRNRLISYLNLHFPKLDQDRITYICHGESKPLVSCDKINAINDAKLKQAAHAKNSRTVIRIEKTDYR